VTSPYARLKAVLDYALAAVLLAASLPVIALAAAAVKVTSKGPAFYTQTRLGKGRRAYKIYKLRTMYHNCEAVSGIRWATRDDPRVTPVGRFLRATHLDELPQLWNVLRGEMSLVGPRPERPEIAARLAVLLPDYYVRTEVKPGLTGLAQILLPPDTDLAAARRKLAVDLIYAGQRTLSLDCRILLGTALHVASVPATWILGVLRLPVERSVVAEGMAAVRVPAVTHPPVPIHTLIPSRCDDRESIRVGF
jgi:lipopolysaccharide/colanic/teichoic acid biosynthesis glycosyltransferase